MEFKCTKKIRTRKYIFVRVKKMKIPGVVLILHVTRTNSLCDVLLISTYRNKKKVRLCRWFEKQLKFVDNVLEREVTVLMFEVSSVEIDSD